ncbi:hypoxanthine phosphoribosyltransferase [Pollutibacter soli]|uniref:hypoxanthine phosphoribosyltransferase n=1 Tax=Pollutibacter soli TaxID=3034157 RepID=UPI003013F298
MDTIQVHDKKFKPYITAEQITAEVRKLADELSKDYAGRKPLFLAILNGSFIFAADIFRALSIPAEICFIKLVSYKGTKSTGEVITSIGLDAEVYDRDVVIIEDIIDTGRTLSQFLPQLEHQQPRSLKICALLHKKECTVYPIPIDYLGFTIPDRFVVGYGLDYDGYGRNINGIYQLEAD